MEMKVVCDECGEELEVNLVTISPGYNGPTLHVKPCCFELPQFVKEELNELEYLRAQFNTIMGMVDEYKAR